MNFDVSTRGLDKLNLLANEVEEALDIALDAGAKVAENAVVRQVQKTYSRAIPTRAEYARASKRQSLKAAGRKRVTKKMLAGVGNGAKGSEPAWTRSGDLRRDIKTRKPSKLERIIGPEGNSTKPISGYPDGYAQKLGELKPGPDGVNRRNAFGPEAQKISEKQVAAKIEQELKNLLRF